MKKSLIALLLASLTMTGCSADFQEEDESDGVAKVSIRFHVDAKSAEGMAYKKVIDAFNLEYKSKNIKANASYVARTAGDSAYEQELSKDAQDGTLPDIITFDSPNCAAYAENGYLYDVTDKLSEAEKSQYTTLNMHNGKVYGIPIQESSAGFYYNKALFNQAGINVSGITVDNPWTYDQFKSVCAQLAAKSITPVDMRMDAVRDETATYLLYPFVYASGGNFVDETGKKAIGYFNSDGSKRGYQFLKDLVNANYTNYGIGATDFFDGKVGMYLSAGWTIGELDHQYTEKFPNRDSWGLLPYPKDVKAASANGSWSFAITNNRRSNKTPVVELLRYITSANSSRTITAATSMIPANKEVVASYAPVAGSAEDTLYQQLTKTSISRPNTVGYPELSAAFRKVISGLRDSEVSSLVDSKAQELQTNLNRI